MSISDDYQVPWSQHDMRNHIASILFILIHKYIVFCAMLKHLNYIVVHYGLQLTYTAINCCNKLLQFTHTNSTALIQPSFSGLFVTCAYLPHTTLPPCVTKPNSLMLTCKWTENKLLSIYSLSHSRYTTGWKYTRNSIW